MRVLSHLHARRNHDISDLTRYLKTLHGTLDPTHSRPRALLAGRQHTSVRTYKASVDASCMCTLTNVHAIPVLTPPRPLACCVHTHKRTHTNAHTQTYTRAHARTRARARVHTHTRQAAARIGVEGKALETRLLRGTRGALRNMTSRPLWLRKVHKSLRFRV
jgi:hypothetical protein